MLKQRLMVGLSLGGVCLLALLTPGIPGAVLFTLLSLALVWVVLGEYAAMSRGMGNVCQRLPLQVFGGLLLLAIAVPSLVDAPAWRFKLELALLLAFLATTALVAISADDLPVAVNGWLATLAGLALLYGTLGFIPRLYFSEGLAMRGRYLVLFMVAVTKFGDIGAYTLGMLTARRPGGNRKLWPKVSPKKSWEGLAGGILASVLIAWLLLLILPIRDVFGGFSLRGLLVSGVLAVVLTLAGLLGDLLESACKRAAKMKDSGRVPGLGGVFDFVDSLLFNAPLFYLIYFCLGQK